MSNLATMIMEGSMGVSGRLKHTYGHEDGAALIAMESAEALRDIFEAEFYVPNTCTIKAAMEGASCVEESSQAAIMEASIKGAFQKIKEFFIKLKDKVVAFLHQIKRYLLGIFGNDVKWVKNYEKDLNALSTFDLKDYEVKMYKYNDDLIIDKNSGIKADELINATKAQMKDEFDNVDNPKYRKERDEEALDKIFDDKYSDFVKGIFGQNVDEDDIDKELWSLYRNGADGESDKEDISVGPTQIKQFIKSIKESEKNVSAYDKCISNTKSSYDKCIKFVDKAADAVDKTSHIDGDEDSYKISGANMTGSDKGTHHYTSTQKTNYTMYLRKLSSHVSKQQSLLNKKYNAGKTALVERNNAYKKALTGAFAYARKNRKKNK